MERNKSIKYFIGVLALMVALIVPPMTLKATNGECKIGGVTYPSIHNALSDVLYGETATIDLLDNMDTSNINIGESKNITINTNGYSLKTQYLVTTDYAKLTINGNVETTDANVDNVSAYAHSNLTINGNLTTNASSSGWAIYANGGSTIKVTGATTGNGKGIAVLGGSTINVGSVTTKSYPLSVDSSTATVSGNIVAGPINSAYAIEVFSTSTVTVTGDIVITSDSKNIIGVSYSNLTVNGNISTIGDHNHIVVAYGTSKITINGNISATGVDNSGAETSDTAEITVNGEITGVGQYIWTGSIQHEKEPFPGITNKGGIDYYDYTNGSSSSHVYVAKDIIVPVDPLPVLDKYTELSFTYPKVDDAEYYQVYRSTSKTKGFKKVAELTGTTYYDYYLAAGTTYYYKVRSVKKVGKKLVYGKYTTPTPLKTTALPIVNTNVTATADSKAIKFHWDNNNNMSAIQIYYATTNTKKTKWAVMTVSASDFTLRKLTGNKKYYYKVRYIYYSGNTCYSGFSAVKEVTTGN